MNEQAGLVNVQKAIDILAARRSHGWPGLTLAEAYMDYWAAENHAIDFPVVGTDLAWLGFREQSDAVDGCA